MKTMLTLIVLPPKDGQINYTGFIKEFPDVIVEAKSMPELSEQARISFSIFIDMIQKNLDRDGFEVNFVDAKIFIDK